MRSSLTNSSRLHLATPSVWRGLAVLILAVVSSGCMRAMGGGMFTVQHDGKLGGEARGATGLGQPGVISDDVGVAGSVEAAVGYDERAGASGAFGPAVDYYFGGAAPWAFNLGASFQTRFSVEDPGLALAAALDLGVTYTLSESRAKVEMLNLGTTARYQWAPGFRPDPLQSGLFGLGLYYDSFHCVACQNDDIRYRPPDR